MTHSRPLAAVVLAAGEGTRMKSSVPKVLHPLCGRPMLLYVVGKDGEPDRHGVARPPLDPLLDELEGYVGLPLQCLDDLLRPMADNDDDPL